MKNPDLDIEIQELAKQAAKLGDNPLYQTLIQNDELQNIINAELEKRVKALEKKITEIDK